jgi:hypothetical protein
VVNHALQLRKLTYSHWEFDVIRSSLAFVFAALFLSFAGCSPKSEAPAAAQLSASTASGPAPTAEESAGLPSVDELAGAMKQALNGEPPKCSDEAVTKMVRSRLIEGLVKPTAQHELSAVGIEGWKVPFADVFTQRIPLAVAKIQAGSIVSPGYNEGNKIRVCTADLAFAGDTLGAATLHATYSVQPTEDGSQYLVRSEFAGETGPAGLNQARWIQGFVLRAMFASEIAANEAARPAAKPAPASSAASDADQADEASSPPSHP